MHSAQPEVDDQSNGSNPSWNALYELTDSQCGLFSRDQARQAGFSDQLLHKHVLGGRLERVHRGIYRLTRFPESARAQEDLVAAWLWSGSAGVFSHETALQLHGLTDLLPAKLTLTLPAAWQRRRLTPPPGVRVCFADLSEADRCWIGAVPVTTPARSINDLAAAMGDLGQIEAAVLQALRRGIATPGQLLGAVEALAVAQGWAGQRPRPTPPGSWSLEVVSGTGGAPPARWQEDAVALAAEAGASLRHADYAPLTRVMTIELTWPSGEPGRAARSAEVRAAAARRFGWEP
jgi:hypothetical protein